MHFLYSAENLTIILALPKVELRVINESLKTCNTTFELAPVSSEKMKYIFFPMSSDLDIKIDVWREFKFLNKVFQ